jgi:hypothetical protein
MRRSPSIKPFAVVFLAAALLAHAEETVRPQVKVIEGGESKATPAECRGIIVGPGINQPDAFPGYAGFVGWESPIRLQNGDWLVGFNAGYWHASVATPMPYTPANLEAFRKMGMPTNIEAPTGGRAMFTRSTDEGKTWSKPETLIDTPAETNRKRRAKLPRLTFFSFVPSTTERHGRKSHALSGRPISTRPTVRLRS